MQDDTPYAAHAQQAVQAALRDGYLDEHSPALLVHDLTRVAQDVNALLTAFPQSAVHTFAIKANPVVRFLEILVQQGMGLEAASMEEVDLALAAGCPPSRLWFDSPVKTPPEIKRALAMGVGINVDNWEELTRVANAMVPSCKSRIGLRINPLVGPGHIRSTSVATRDSKFGVPADQEERIVQAFADHPFLTGLHVHAASQALGTPGLVASATRVGELAKLVDKRLGARRVGFVDIGGGLPVKYRQHEQPPSFAELAEGIRQHAPELLSASPTLVTEFGRALAAPSGFAVSRVEYVKDDMVVHHLGADAFVRATYAPQDWYHRIEALDAHGRFKKSQERHTLRVMGPLCFAGDTLGEYQLPTIEPGDYLLIRDTGAYVVGTWSRYCSRRMPAVVGFYQDQPGQLQLLRKSESAVDVVAFWS